MRPPVNGTEVYLAAIHDRLGEILSRLPAPKQEPEDGTVELREPATPETSTVRDISPAEKLTEPAPRAPRRRTKKTGGA